jgi:hypothetical protein
MRLIFLWVRLDSLMRRVERFAVLEVLVDEVAAANVLVAQARSPSITNK